MTAISIDGTRLAAIIRIDIIDQIKKRQIITSPRKDGPGLETTFHTPGTFGPGLAVVIVGDDPASEIYVNQKARMCKAVGIKSRIIKLPHSSSQHDIEHVLEGLATDNSIHGVIVQMPLPEHLDTQQIIEKIPIEKDVDGFHPYNVGRLATRNPTHLRSCTPYGIIKLLESIGESFKDRNAVIVGASNIVGRPMALELLLAGATVTICHKFTTRDNLAYQTKHADILISAIGLPRFFRNYQIKENATLIDVGITRDDDGKLWGDFNNEVWEKAAYVTPVPGGVGPVTVAMLLQNTVNAWIKSLT